MAAERTPLVEALSEVGSVAPDVNIDWAAVRRSDNTISLVRAFELYFPLNRLESYTRNDPGSVGQHVAERSYGEALRFLRLIESIHPTRSRQVAAVALAMARMHV